MLPIMNYASKSIVTERGALLPERPPAVKSLVCTYRPLASKEKHCWKFPNASLQTGSSEICFLLSVSPPPPPPPSYSKVIVGITHTESLFAEAARTQTCHKKGGCFNIPDSSLCAESPRVCFTTPRHPEVSLYNA